MKNTLRLLLIGSGFMEGDFKEEEKVLKEKVANIEPLVEAQLQTIIQSVILYTITFENQIDLSSLLYSDTTSKITYFLMLLSSLVSICISFTKMLRMGHEPVLTSIFTTRAGIVFLFLVTKFLLLAYLHSLAITSMMMGLVGSIIADNDPAHIELFDMFHSGLCPPPKDPMAFCGEDSPLTLYSITRIIPTLMLFHIYFLPILYLVILNIKRARKLSYETIIHLIFPLVTNLSFFGPIPPDPFKMKMKRTKRQSIRSMPCLEHLETIPEVAVERGEKALFRQKTVPSTCGKFSKTMTTRHGKSQGDGVFMIGMASLDIDTEKASFQREKLESPAPRGQSKKTMFRRYSLPTNMESCLTKGSEDKTEFQFSLRQSTTLYVIFLYNAILIGLFDGIVRLQINMRNNHCKRTGEECNIEEEQMTLLEILMKVDPINQAYIAVLITNIIAFISFAISLKKDKEGGSCINSSTCQELIKDW